MGTGEQDQKFDGNPGSFNGRIRDPKSILLYFQKKESNQYVFKYRAKYNSHTLSIEPNKDNVLRKMIKFKLQIVKTD